MASIRDTVWHRWLRRPYRLACITDTGKGQTVVLLHGLGRHAGVWEHLVGLLSDKPYRVLAFDLLGFGTSPKPEWVNYNVDDHVDAVVAAIRRKAKGQVILVGHSMGSLISVRIARRHPQLVKHLVLYEMPLYSGLPDTRRYRMRLDFYYGLYKRIVKYQPLFDTDNIRVGQRIAERLMETKITADVWRAFVNSLEHTIMEQQTGEDMRHVKAPVDIIYGTRDQLVIRGKTQLLFGEDIKNITAHTIKESHRITPKASAFIAERIEAAATDSTADEIKAGRPLYRRLRRRKDGTAEVVEAVRA